MTTTSTEWSRDTKLETLLQRSAQLEQSIDDFISWVKGYSKKQARDLLTDIIDVTKRYPHRASHLDQMWQSSANHIPWTSLIDILRGSPMRTERRDLPVSDRSWSISSGWFTTYLRNFLTSSGLFELYRDPHNKGTQRLRYIHHLATEPAALAFSQKRVRIMPSRPDLDSNDYMHQKQLGKQPMVGRTGKAEASHSSQLHGDDAYFVDLDPIRKEEINSPICWIVIGDELEPLP